MRFATPAMLELIASNVTTLCRLWSITRRDGVTLRFTDLDKDILFEGEIYRADNSFMASAVQGQTNSAGSDLDVSVLLAPGSIEYFDLARGMYDGAPIILQIVSYENLDAGAIVLFAGKVSTFTLPNMQTALLSLRGGVKQITKDLTERYSATCRAIFGDHRCKFPVETVTLGFTVDSFSGLQQFAASELAPSPTNRFTLGTVEWLTGANAGVRIEAAGNTTGTGLVRLLFQTPFAMQVGDTGVISQDCPKTVDACMAYANIANYRGEPYVPGDEGIGVN